MAERILITSALPYANGPLHIGHLVEYVQTDIYVRFLRSAGKDVVYFCADDTHGTPIELAARKEGIEPEKYVARWFEEHQRDMRDMDIRHDYYWSTHSEENRRYSELIYSRLKEAGDIERRDVEQTYCETDRRFLPDRFVRGTCPNCKSPDQYGDVCEKCGKTYSPTDLIDPCCAICGNPPVRRSSTHLFFKLGRHTDFLRNLVQQPSFLYPSVAGQLAQFFEKGLADWDISRDGPYFGFPIPGEKDKYFYVWLDAPIGYIATTEKWAKETGRARDAMEYWAAGSDARILHFIGKDIVYFHALFWPAVLKTAGFKVPNRVQVHGHLTFNGEKMSKSRGTLVAGRTYLDLLDPSYLRFFYALNLGPGAEDLDLSLTEFRQRVNAELVNNIANLANRALSLIAGSLEGRLAPPTDAPGRQLVEDALAKAAQVRESFERFDFRAAMKAIVEIGQSANQFLQSRAPWALVKKDPEAARTILSDAAEVVYLLAGLLEPVVPRLSKKLFEQLAAPALTYGKIANARYPLLERGRTIGTPAPLIARIEDETLRRLVIPDAEGAPAPEKGRARGEPARAQAVAENPDGAPGEIEYGEFSRVVLKVGKILSAARVPKSDKLLQLSVDVGEGTP
ncbi:MAG TPA: methionine--tRNA ligase, partial [Myxococcaceae bacterium]|nr:methionine--tRNA ligase [Myxococcaceae bacterium]